MIPNAPFEPYADPGPRYPGMQVRSEYLAMRDGTRLAADIYLPRSLTPGERLPTILYQTRYWRASELRPPLGWLVPPEGDPYPATRRGKAFFVTRGYAIVVVDVRGTGASFGVSRYPWEAVTIQDASDILDWIVARPWSNGRVAGMGLSYLGTTAELLLATRHPALRAVIPQFNHPDSFVDIAMPGGLINERFLRAWTELNDALDHNRSPRLYGPLLRKMTRGVRPVGGEAGREALSLAVLMHAANGGMKDLEATISFRDERHPVGGYSLEDQGVMRFREELQESRVPVYGWASWLDAGTGQAALRRWMSLPGPQMAVIGAWNHGGMQQSSPYRPGQVRLAPPREVQQREILRFLDLYLKDAGGAERLENSLYYYTLGAEIWQKTTTWPPPGIQRVRWYLGPGGTLSRAPFEKAAGANGDQPDPADRYEVNFQASTGVYNRWWELGVLERQPVDYGDRALQKPFVLGYETAPFERDIEITGSPVVTLYVSVDQPDCAFYVYLEDVFPAGRIAYLTEGQLRALHRRVIPAAEAPYRLEIPYHSFRAGDALPLVPGEVAEITFGLLPVSARIQRGHRLRISIAGHDAGTFIRVPGNGAPVWTVFRGERYPSALDLPMKEQAGQT